MHPKTAESDSSADAVRAWPIHPVRLVGIALILAVLVGWDGYHRTPTMAAEGTTLNGASASPLPVDKQTFRVGTFNIDGLHGIDGKLNLDRTADSVRGCDLIGFQEVHGRTLTDARDQAQLLGEKLRMPWLYAPSERQWWRDSFGNAMITSLPISSWQRFPLSGPAATNNRSLLLVHLPLNGRMLHVLITHLPTTNDRESQLRSVSELFLSLQEPAMLIGDLNTRPGDAQIERLRATPGVIDAVDREDVQHVDWIFARGLKFVKGDSIDHGASDHPFYWADFGRN